MQPGCTVFTGIVHLPRLSQQKKDCRLVTRSTLTVWRSTELITAQPSGPWTPLCLSEASSRAAGQQASNNTVTVHCMEVVGSPLTEIACLDNFLSRHLAVAQKWADAEDAGAEEFVNMMALAASRKALTIEEIRLAGTMDEVLKHIEEAILSNACNCS
ncbi:hypothetical protein NDU88_010660 [Pleurodeles waltl]|uniref:Uncharacterized protein n=1 Tax=Pleurodeles waltl TaxID=8319 RepID=A0AAV7PW73_PLEWA|nr:hypothetical protein NDU88_010660 [Pleurodeles waltl]